MIDELENAKAAEAGHESPAATTKAITTTTPSGSVLVSKTEDLTPPKGIVNSAQLEMEFMRVFANAVMFNPLPPSERGVPPELKKQKDSTNQRLRSRKSRSKEADDAGGGGGNGEDAAAAAAAEVVEKKGYAVEEEGGIIHDTREMFASVEKAVQQWRSVEQGYIDDMPRSSAGLGLAVGLGLRGGSVSASVSDVLAEESGLEEGERDRDIASGSTRKRRRLAE